MGKGETNASNSVNETSKPRFTVSQLFESKRFSKKYQYDLAKQVLQDKTYTPKEAESILDNYFANNNNNNNNKKGD